MMRLMDEVQIESREQDQIDIKVRGESCFDWEASGHEFFLTTHACRLTYQICGRCGTVRVEERR